MNTVFVCVEHHYLVMYGFVTTHRAHDNRRTVMDILYMFGEKWCSGPDYHPSHGKQHSNVPVAPSGLCVADSLCDLYGQVLFIPRGQTGAVPRQVPRGLQEHPRAGSHG